MPMNNTEKGTVGNEEEKKDLEQEAQPREEQDEKSEKEEIIYIDDHHTVADMNVEGLPWYVKGGHHREKKVNKLSFKEKFAIVFGAYRAYLPIILAIGSGFLFVFLLLKLIWG